MTRVVAKSIRSGKLAQAARPFRLTWIVASLLAAITSAGVARAAVTPSGATAAADAFYLELLRTGAEAYERKDFPSAVTDLRLACFGFLDQPSLLAEGLVRLGLAQAAGGDRESFLTTFGRLAEVERRFSVYSQGLGEDLRRAFATVSLGLVPPAQYGALPGLPELAQRQALADLVGLPPSKRRAELEKRAAAQPEEVRWLLLLAQLDLEQKKPAAAVKRLDLVLAKTPGDADARCLRGRASAEAGRCDAAIVDLRQCPRSGEEPALARQRLECLVEAKNWTEANAVLAGLSETARKDAAIAKLAPRVAAGAASGASQPASPAVAKPTKPAVANAPPAAAPRASANAPTTSSNKPPATTQPASAGKPPVAPAATPPPVVQTEAQMLAAIESLPPRKRRAELEKRAAAQPGEARWQLLLAALDLEQDKAAAAAKRLDAVLLKTPDHTEAHCLRGRAWAEAGRCELAVSDLRRCPRSDEEAALVGARLACLVEVKNWSEATELVAGLPEPLRRDSKIAKLVPKVAAAAAGGSTAEPVTPGKPAKPASRPGTQPPASASNPSAGVVPPPAKPSPAGTPPTPPSAAGSVKPAAPAPSVLTPPPATPASPLPGPSVPLAAPMAADELAELERARQMLRSARVVTDVAVALSIARGIADAHPSDREAQLLTAEIAYRASLWRDAVTYFERADPGDKQPALLFYYAVALYESGNRPRAAAVLQRCLSKLQLTPVVQSYVERILGPGAADGTNGIGEPEGTRRPRP